jgi:hypothetical protein
VASYHLCVKVIGRSSGRSATAAAAYRAAERIRDARTGELHDYARRSGVVHREIVLPEGAPPWAGERAALWNAAEAAETRRNSSVAREFEVALPAELSADQRRALATDFARELIGRHGFAVDLAVHAPGRGSDVRNHHAHLLCTTRRLTPAGFTAKTRELDDLKSGEVARWRERWAVLQNERLRELGIESAVDHRSLKARGEPREPGAHKGPAVTAIERRGGWSYVLERQREEISERLARAAAMGRAERVLEAPTLIDVSTDVAAARARATDASTSTLKV